MNKKYSLKRYLLIEKVDSSSVESLVQKWLAFGGGGPTDTSNENQIAAYGNMLRSMKERFGDESTAILKVFKEIASKTTEGRSNDIQSLDVWDANTRKRGEGWKAKKDQFKALVEWFTDLHNEEIILDGERPGLTVGMDIKFDGTYAIPSSKDANYYGEFEVTHIDKNKLKKKVKSDKAEEVAAALLGGWTVGGTGYSFDAMDSERNHWEVKLLSKLGATARLGAGGAAVGSTELTHIRILLESFQTELDFINGSIDSPPAEFQFLADQSSVLYKAVVEIRDHISHILERTYGVSRPTDLPSLAARGELSAERVGGFHKDLIKLEYTLTHCKDVLNDPQLKSRMASSSRKQSKYIQRSSASLMHMLVGQAEQFICDIEGRIYNHQYFDDLNDASDRESHIAALSALGNAGFSQFMADYCDAKPYAQAEKAKKVLHGFVFVIGDPTEVGCKVFVLSKGALMAQAKIGNVFTAGFTQQTPSIGFKK